MPSGDHPFDDEIILIKNKNKKKDPLNSPGHPHSFTVSL